MLSVVLAIALAHGVPHGDLTNDTAPAEPPKPAAAAVLSALRVYEESIRTVEYEVAVYTKRAGGEQLSRRTHEWWDASGKWAAEFKRQRPKSPDSKELITQTDLWAFDGTKLHGRDPDKHAGVIREPMGEWTGYTSPLALLGRYADGKARRPLWRLLTESEGLELGDRDGKPTLTGIVDLGYVVAELTVVVDPAHGTAPATVEIRDGVLRCLYGAAEVAEWVRVGDVWLPAAGRDQRNSIDPKGEGFEEFSRLLKEAGIEGKPKPSDAAQVQAARAAAKRVWGETGPRVRSLGSLTGDEGQRCEVKYLMVNKPIPHSRFVIEYELGDKVYDEFTDTVKQPGSMEFKPQ